MNTARLKLLAVPFAAPAASRCHSRLHRAVLQFFRAMASANSNPGPKKGRQKEPLRWLKTNENRSGRVDLHSPSTVYVQVVGAGSRDNAASLYVFSEYNR